MLLRQDLSRRHQSDLVSIFDGDNSRLEGDNRLAGSDIPLQQPAHREGRLQISDNFFQYAFLCGGGMKRQDFFDRFACTGADLEGNSRTRSLFAPLELKAELDKEEFVKDQTDVRREYDKTEGQKNSLRHPASEPSSAPLAERPGSNGRGPRRVSGQAHPVLNCRAPSV